jgi:hypothetical protein
MQTQVPVPAIWTDDCQGKKDYDGSLVTLSVRYWPRGGSALVVERVGGHVQMTEGSDPGRQRRIPPSAHATIYLGSTRDEFYDAAVKLTEISVEAETEADVKEQVEAWAITQFLRIQRALQAEFSSTEPHP